MGTSTLKHRLTIVVAACAAAFVLVCTMGALAPAGSAAVPTAQASKPATYVAAVYNGPTAIVNKLNKSKSTPTVKTASLTKTKLVLKSGKYGKINIAGTVMSMKKAKSFKLAKGCKFYKQTLKNGSYKLTKVSKNSYKKALKSLSKKRGNTVPRSIGAISFATNSKGHVTDALYYVYKR